MAKSTNRPRQRDEIKALCSATGTKLYELPELTGIQKSRLEGFSCGMLELSISEVVCLRDVLTKKLREQVVS